MSKGTQLVPHAPKLSTLDYWDQMAREHQQLVPVAPLPAVIPDPFPIPATPEPAPAAEPSLKEALIDVKMVEFLIRYDPEDEEDTDVVLAEVDMDAVDHLVDAEDEIEDVGTVTIQIQWPFTQTIAQQAKIVGKPWTRADLLTFVLHVLQRFEEAAMLNELTGAGEEHLRISRPLTLCVVVGAIRVRPRYWVVMLEEHL